MTRYYVEVTETVGYSGDQSESCWTLRKYRTEGEIRYFESRGAADEAAEDYFRDSDRETMGGYPIDYTWEVLEEAS